MMPKSFVRLSAGIEMQALCFFAGGNLIFVGDKLLTAANPEEDKDTIVDWAFPRWRSV
jgi:biotin synthase